MRSLLPVSLLFICLNAINAQNQQCDSLYFTNGQVITAQVSSKSDSIVRYTICGDSTRQQYEVKSKEASFISPKGQITATSKEILQESPAAGRRQCFKNFLFAGFSPFAGAGLKKYHIGYARAITKRKEKTALITPVTLLTGQAQQKFENRPTPTYNNDYKNLVAAGILPFFNAGITKFHIGYARAISKHWVLNADYTYFDILFTTSSISLFGSDKTKTENRRRRSEFAVSGRIYYKPNQFRSNNFNGFYTKSGVSYARFKGTKYVKETSSSHWYVDYDGVITYTGPTVTEYFSSADAELYSIFIAQGLTVKINRFLLDFDAGIRKSRTRYHDIKNNYTFKRIPVFGNFSIGFTF